MLNIHELVSIALARPDLGGENLIKLYFELLNHNEYEYDIYDTIKLNELNKEAKKFINLI